MGGRRLHLRGPEAVAACDEDTSGVVAVLVSTFDGSYEPVAQIAAPLDTLVAAGGPACTWTSPPVDGRAFLDPDLA